MGFLLISFFSAFSQEKKIEKDTVHKNAVLNQLFPRISKLSKVKRIRTHAPIILLIKTRAIIR